MGKMAKDHTRRVKRPLRIGLGALLVATPTVAYANVGIPMLTYAWPVAWALLIPVIVLEAFVARRVLRANWPRSLKVASLSNLISTLVGIPLAWGAALLVAMGANLVVSALPSTPRSWALMPFYAAWLPPISDRQLWFVPAAGAVLCVPFLLASVWIERGIAQRFGGGFDATDVRRWAWQANLASYSLIAAGLVLVALLLGLRR